MDTASNDNTFIIFTRRNLVKRINMMDRFIRFVKRNNQKMPYLKYGEEIIAEFYALLGGVSVDLKVTKENDSKDDVYGEYPFMLYDTNFITKENIQTFLSNIYDIDKDLSPDQVQESRYLKHLCIQRLQLTTRYNMQLGKEKRRSLTNNFIRPYLTFNNYINAYYFKKFMGKLLNIHNETKAFDQAKAIHEKLSQKLKNKKFFFENEGRVGDGQITSLDIVVYAFLKEEIINTPDSEATTGLIANYKNLISFVERMDQILEKKVENAQRISLKYTKDEIQKVYNQLMTKPEYIAPDRFVATSSLKTAEDVKRDRLKRLYITLIACSFMVFLNYGRHPFNK